MYGEKTASDEIAQLRREIDGLKREHHQNTRRARRENQQNTNRAISSFAWVYCAAQVFASLGMLLYFKVVLN